MGCQTETTPALAVVWRSGRLAKKMKTESGRIKRDV
jgi:hypothetical protein